MQDNLRLFLKPFNILTEDEIILFESKLAEKHLKKGEFLLREGQVSKEVAFVMSGLLRSYYQTSSGDEVTYCFSFPNTFAAAYSSYLSQSSSVLNIQAVEDSVLWSISRKDILLLERSSYSWLKFFKVIAEQEFVNIERRVFLLQKESAKKRYLDMLAHQPEFIKQIPLNYLASYLGITQRHLSRIRRTALDLN